MKRIISIVFLAITSAGLSAQTLPPVNCGDAQSICDSIITVDTIKVGPNTGGNEISNNSCLPFGEVRGTWYKFGVTSTGNLRFLITPVDTTVDFDWALFRTDWAPCTDIFGVPEYEVSCNASGIGGGNYTTGATGLVQQGHSPAVNITTPGLFYLYITTATYNGDDSTAVLGYVLDFSTSDFELVGCGEIGMEHESPVQVNVYPNPFDDYIRIDVPNSVQTEVNLYDISGRSVANYSLNGNTLSTHNLPSGMYTLVVRTEKGVASRKVVKY